MNKNTTLSVDTNQISYIEGKEFREKFSEKRGDNDILKINRKENAINTVYL